MDSESVIQNSIWNQRFAEKEYAYGKEPNEWFAQHLKSLPPGNLLLPAEGEGRNAIFAARLLWHVSAFDSSHAGREKAKQLAHENHVQIAYEIDDYEHFMAPPKFFDCVGLIYAHSPLAVRKPFHAKIRNWLKPGGTVILEGFSKNQLGRSSGGPKDPDWLYDKESLLADFEGYASVHIEETEVVLNEGPFHQGAAMVMRLVAKL